MNEEEINRKLDFIAKAYTTLHNEIIRRRLPEDDFALNQISKLLHAISKIAHQFSSDTKERETFRMPDEFVELIGTMRFIAKRMDYIEKRFKELDGLDFKHNVKITVDSSSLDRFNSREKNEDPYEKLLLALPPSYAKALTLSFGIYDKPKTCNEISAVIGKGRSTVAKMIREAIKMCRSIEMIPFVNRLPEGKLRYEILGK
jgi:hypothetical protein